MCPSSRAAGPGSSAAVEELCRDSEEGLRYRRGDLAEEGRAGGRRKGSEGEGIGAAEKEGNGR